MSDQPHLDPHRRHDFLLLFDCTDGNPNGDPDAGNLPRVDPETMQGLVTDVAIKRKVRDRLTAAGLDAENARHKIYVEQRAVLNAQHQRAYDALELTSIGAKQPRAEVDKTRAWMCHNFFDVRMFGAVMSTGVNCGQVRGPVQLTFARSIDPIVPIEVTITRVAVTKEGEDKETEMGRKSIIPYGLYLARGFFTPQFAKDTGVDAEDMALLWKALVQMWEIDRSATRGMMACQGLYVFSHDNALGDAPAHKLFERLHVSCRDGVDAPRSFSDYEVTLDDEALPSGITLKSLV